jgi:hypothetical protein
LHTAKISFMHKNPIKSYISYWIRGSLLVPLLILGVAKEYHRKSM